MKKKSILYPTDFSAGSLAALPYVVDMAKTYGAKLYLMHVIYDMSTASELFVASAEALQKELEEKAKREIENFGRDQRKD